MIMFILRFTLICMFFMLISKLEDSIFTRISEYKDTISKLLVVQKPLFCCPVIFLEMKIHLNQPFCLET